MAIFNKPKYSTVTVKRKEIPKNLYTRCPVSGEIIYNQHLEENLMVVPKSGYHFPLPAPQRIAATVDEGSWKEEDADLVPVDALGFKDLKPYAERLKAYQQKSGLKEAIVTGVGRIEGVTTSLAVMDFRFVGASMGAVVGEKITRAIERAVERKLPLVMFISSGGARMQEGIFSLMQMAKTSAALARLREAGLPYIAILTNPTTGGVTASFATLGDVILAEPGALIGFAGPRVIEETIREKLPEGFQRSEFLLEHGLIDQIVPRGELRARLVHFLHALHVGKAPESAA